MHSTYDLMKERKRVLPEEVHSMSKLQHQQQVRQMRQQTPQTDRCKEKTVSGDTTKTNQIPFVIIQT